MPRQLKIRYGECGCECGFYGIPESAGQKPTKNRPGQPAKPAFPGTGCKGAKAGWKSARHCRGSRCDYK